jgi:hypothetical protein
MRDFSAGEAIGAGFRLIGREPIAVLAWTAIYFLIGFLPQMAVFAAFMPDMAAMTHDSMAAAARGEAASAGEMMRMQLKMMQLQPISWLSGLVSLAIILGAIYRAILFPGDRRFFYLRLSMREVWLGLIVAVLAILFFLLTFAIMLPTAAIGGIVAASAQQAPAIGLVMFVVIPAAVALLCWVLLRLSLSPPMSFARGQFQLAESWGLARGHAWKMFCVALALLVIMMIAEMVVVAICLLAGAGALPSAQAIDAWFQHPKFNLLSPLVLIGGLAFSLLTVAFYTVAGGAWAEIYRQLTAESTD